MAKTRVKVRQILGYGSTSTQVPTSSGPSTDPAWGAGGGGGGTPGGADTEVQYNAAGVFAGANNFTITEGPAGTWILSVGAASGANIGKIILGGTSGLGSIDFNGGPAEIIGANTFDIKSTAGGNGVRVYTSGALRFRIGDAGELMLGAGSDPGTAGYVITSGGAGGQPTWAALPAATPSVAGIMKKYTILGSNTDGAIDQNTATVNLALKANLTDVIGVQDLYIDAVALQSKNTNGFTLNKATFGSIDIVTADFDYITQQFGYFKVVLPRKWNNGTVTAEVVWTALSGSGGVVFGLSGAAYSNDDPLTGALGTAQTMTDTLTATNDQCTTPTSAAITLSGSPTGGDLLVFQFSRNPADASDTLAAAAKVIGIRLHLTTTAAKDA